ncbi:hypothetical protein RJ55_06481 [Drechmeria coniospora]|nr:hypothetical protein RJ55_06481 [Drechmeria coniospora]
MSTPSDRNRDLRHLPTAPKTTMFCYRRPDDEANGAGSQWIGCQEQPGLRLMAEDGAVPGETKGDNAEAQTILEEQPSSHSELKCLVEGVDEVWCNARPLTGPAPKLDYCVGFNRSAFTAQQLQKLQPLISNASSEAKSDCMATSRMLFPFLASEVKRGREALDEADNKNAHSLTIALRDVVQIFQLAGGESEVRRQILGFSFSHDNQNVRIYGHYAEVDGTNIQHYRHDIRKCNIYNIADHNAYPSAMDAGLHQAALFSCRRFTDGSY